MVRVVPEEPLDVVREVIDGHREQRCARRFIRVKMPIRRVADITGASALADFQHHGGGVERRVVHGELCPLGLLDRADIPPIAPGELVLLFPVGEFAADDVRAEEHIRALRVAEINEIVVHGESSLLHDGAHFRESSVLIPAAALVKPSKRQECGEEKQDLQAARWHAANLAASAPIAASDQFSTLPPGVSQ